MKPGTQLGPYRVDSLIGAGGMGEVYLGVDTRLDRQVAIKVLSRHMSDSAGLRERFEREARTISSLSHPNICTLFDVGRYEASDYLVMEYLHGETLADRIAKGPIRPDEVVRFGTEIASALDRAHKQGIIHRDLKPGNIMLTKSGVKLLDFGLAKVVASPLLSHPPSNLVQGSGGGESPSSGPTQMARPTEQRALTEQGSILGTFQYMAPEQLEGREADPRSDIFALGAILYEMATGHRAFSGTSKASLIASIMDRDPRPMSEVQPATPRSLERLVRACLMKDPDERIQTAHDVALELRWISESSSVAEGPMARPRRKAARWAPWLATALVGVLAISSGGLWWRERMRPAPAYSLSISPPAGQSIGGMSAFALSPDGKMLAFAASPKVGGDSTLRLRRLDDGSERQLDSKDGSPFWSPDGQWIGFMRQPDLMMRVRPDGGEPESICRTSLQGTAAWNEEGTILFAPRFGGGLSHVRASGGEPEVLTRLDAARRESFHGNPQFLPDGKSFLFIVHTTSDKRNEIWAGSLDGAKPHQVLSADALVGYSKPYLLFVREGAVYAQRFDPRRQRVEGESLRVLENVVYSESAAASSVSLSRAGALVYQRFRGTRVLLNAYDRTGALSGTIWHDDSISEPWLSQDERTLVASKWIPEKGATDVYAVELARGIATRLTSGLASHAVPVLSSDQQSVVFQSDRDGMFDLYSKSVDGTSERLVWKDDRDKWPTSFSPDGKFLLVGRWTPETRSDMWIVPMGTGEKPWLFLGSEFTEASGVFSPDGKLVTYVSDQSGDAEVYVRGFPSGRSVRVSTDGGGAPSWSSDGRELLWVAKGNRVMSAPVDASGPRLEVGAPKQLFTLPNIWSRAFFMKDGRIAMLVPAPDADTTFPLDFTTAWRSKIR